MVRASKAANKYTPNDGCEELLCLCRWCCGVIGLFVDAHSSLVAYKLEFELRGAEQLDVEVEETFIFNFNIGLKDYFWILKRVNLHFLCI